MIENSKQKCSPLDTVQATAMFAVHRRLFLITVIISRFVFCCAWFKLVGCRPYCLLAFSGSVLSASKSLLSQDQCRWSSSLAMFQLIHKWHNKLGNPKSNLKLITGENFNILWPILRERGCIPSSCWNSWQTDRRLRRVWCCASDMTQPWRLPIANSKHCFRTTFVQQLP